MFLRNGGTNTLLVFVSCVIVTFYDRTRGVGRADVPGEHPDDERVPREVGAPGLRAARGRESGGGGGAGPVDTRAPG